MPFNLYAEAGVDFHSRAPMADVASSMAHTIARIEPYLGGFRCSSSMAAISEFIDHRAMLDLADLAERIGGRRLVLQTNLRSAKRITDVLGDNRITVEVAG